MDTAFQEWHTAITDEALVLCLSTGPKDNVAFQIGAILALYDLGLLPRVRVFSSTGTGSVAMSMLFGAVLDTDEQHVSYEQQRRQWGPPHTCFGPHEWHRSSGLPRTESTDAMGCHSTAHASRAWKRWFNRVTRQPDTEELLTSSKASLLPTTTLSDATLYTNNASGQYVPVHESVAQRPPWTHRLLSRGSAFCTQNSEAALLRARLRHPRWFFNFRDPASSRRIFENSSHFPSGSAQLWPALVTAKHYNTSCTSLQPVILMAAAYNMASFSHDSPCELKNLMETHQVHEIPTRNSVVCFTNDQSPPRLTIGLGVRFHSWSTDAQCQTAHLLAATALPLHIGTGGVIQTLHHGHLLTDSADDLDPYALRGADAYFTSWRLKTRDRILLIDGYTNTKMFHRQSSAVQELADLRRGQLLVGKADVADGHALAYRRRIVTATTCPVARNRLLQASHTYGACDSRWGAMTEDMFQQTCNWGYTLTVHHYASQARKQASALPRATSTTSNANNHVEEHKSTMKSHVTDSVVERDILQNILGQTHDVKHHSPLPTFNALNIADTRSSPSLSIFEQNNMQNDINDVTQTNEYISPMLFRRSSPRFQLPYPTTQVDNNLLLYLHRIR
jgi:hypothetical protein